MIRLEEWRLAFVVICSAAIVSVQVGCTAPLLGAAAAGDTQKVLQLLKDGHHPDEAFPIVGTRPLMVAAAYGHSETVQALLSSGANVNAEDMTGWTALHAGAFKGDAATVAILLKNGAALTESRWFLASPQEIAETLDNKEALLLLREAKDSSIKP